MRRYNVTGLCVPKENYMVDISGKVEQIRKMVDDRQPRRNIHDACGVQSGAYAKWVAFGGKRIFDIVL